MSKLLSKEFYGNHYYQLYNMKMIKHVYGIRAVVKNRANESCGQICCYIFD